MRTALKIVNLSMLLLLAGCTEKNDRLNDGDRRESARRTDPAAHEDAAGPKSKDNAEPDPGEVTLRVVTPQQYRDALAERTGRVVLVDFWATWCAPCRKQFPHTVAMSREHASRDLAVVSVSLDDPESKESALEFLKEHEATFTNLMSSLGGDEEAIQAFGVDPGRGIPCYQVFGRDGELLATLYGEEATAEAIETAVDGALGMQKPE